MAYEIRARSMGEILDGAFQLYRNHFSTFLATAATISLPSLVVLAVVNWAITGTLSAEPTPQGLGRYWLVLLIFMPVSFATYLLQQSVLTVAIADAYLGRPLSMKAAFGRTASVLGPLIGATLIAYLVIGFGLLLLIVPGIYFALSWAFSIQAITIEGCGPYAALTRSNELASGRRGRLFLLILFLSVLNIAIVWGVGAVIPDSVRSLPLLGSILHQAPAILVMPLHPAVLTLAYFDARVRSEAFDLEVLARTVGGGAADPRPAAAPIV
jgi:hypothetical protein